MANANNHMDPKALAYIQDTSTITPHRDSGNARALEKSGAIGKLNVAMYICLRTAIWTLRLTLKGSLWALLNRDQAAQAGQPSLFPVDGFYSRSNTSIHNSVYARAPRLRGAYSKIGLL